MIEVRKSKQKALTGRQARAVRLVAEDEKSNQEIAQTLGVSRSAIDLWKTQTHFQEAVSAHIAKLQQNLERYSIARKDRRVAILDELLTRGLEVKKARAIAYKDKAPGGHTGLVVRQIRTVGVGETAKTVAEWSVDTGFIASMTSLLKAAKEETGKLELDININLAEELRDLLQIPIRVDVIEGSVLALERED